MPEHQIGRTRPAGIPEHSDNHFLTYLTRTGMTDGHRKVELFLDNLRTYVLANGQEQQRCKEANEHQVPQRLVYHEALSIPYIAHCGQAIFGMKNMFTRAAFIRRRGREGRSDLKPPSEAH